MRAREALPDRQAGAGDYAVAEKRKRQAMEYPGLARWLSETSLRAFPGIPRALTRGIPDHARRNCNQADPPQASWTCCQPTRAMVTPPPAARQ